MSTDILIIPLGVLTIRIPCIRAIVTVHRSFRAGDDLLIIREQLAEGWSLARKVSKHPGASAPALASEKEPLGLVPQTYYQFTSEFQRIPSPPLPEFDGPPSPSSASLPEPLQGQHTGSGSIFNLRNSLLGGKSLNRFSGFVTSGAEDWVLNGVEPTEVEIQAAENDKSDLDEESSVAESTEEAGAEADMKAKNRNARVGEADRHFVEVSIPYPLYNSSHCILTKCIGAAGMEV